jgi:hypothetical protein
VEVELFISKMRLVIKSVTPSFDFTYFLVDKAKAAMSAIGKEGHKFILCYFHMLQDFERFAKTRDSGIKSKEERALLLLGMAALRDIDDETVFKNKAKDFERAWAEYPKVLTYFQDNWLPIATHWASFGQKDIIYLHCRLVLKKAVDSVSFMFAVLINVLTVFF